MNDELRVTSDEGGAMEISEEKREQMNRLYRAAIDLRRAQLRFFDGVSVRRLQDMQECGEAVGRLLTEINGGRDPVHFESTATSICETAAMLAREGGAK